MISVAKMQHYFLHPYLCLMLGSIVCDCLNAVKIQTLLLYLDPPPPLFFSSLVQKGFMRVDHGILTT